MEDDEAADTLTFKIKKNGKIFFMQCCIFNLVFSFIGI